MFGCALRTRTSAATYEDRNNTVKRRQVDCRSRAALVVVSNNTVETAGRTLWRGGGGIEVVEVEVLICLDVMSEPGRRQQLTTTVYYRGREHWSTRGACATFEDVSGDGGGSGGGGSVLMEEDRERFVERKGRGCGWGFIAMKEDENEERVLTAVVLGRVQVDNTLGMLCFCILLAAGIVAVGAPLHSAQTGDNAWRNHS